MRTLIIINEAPYGDERCYNALRVANALLKQQNAVIDLFLIADAVAAANRGQKTPDGYYNIERMVKRVILGNGRVMLCGTCMDARGVEPDRVLDGAVVSDMGELADSVALADRVLVW